MKRLGRWLFNLAALVSLALLVISAGVWVRSEFVAVLVVYGVYLPGTPMWPVIAQDTYFGVGRGEVSLGRETSAVDMLPAKIPQPGVGRWDYKEFPALGAVSYIPPVSTVFLNLSPISFTESGLGAVHWRSPSYTGMAGDAGGWVSKDTYFVPLWAFVAMFAILPAVWHTALARRQMRRMAGCCLKCGYDLRATPDRCPECGTVPGR
jgi:hypothetical protein